MKRCRISSCMKKSSRLPLNTKHPFSTLEVECFKLPFWSDFSEAIKSQSDRVTVGCHKRKNILKIAMLKKKVYVVSCDATYVDVNEVINFYNLPENSKTKIHSFEIPFPLFGCCSLTVLELFCALRSTCRQV